MRRAGASRREVLPDPKYGSRLVTKFVNMMMFGGKKSTAEQIMYTALGSVEDRAKQFSFTGFTAVDGKVYGQTPIGVMPGFVYNKRIWREAGDTDWPTTPPAILTALNAIKEKTCHIYTSPSQPH